MTEEICFSAELIFARAHEIDSVTEAIYFPTPAMDSTADEIASVTEGIYFFIAAISYALYEVRPLNLFLARILAQNG